MIWLYSIISVIIVSLVSLVGVLTLALKKEKLEHFLLYFVSFSVGALFGDVFLHIIPHLTEEHGFSIDLGLLFLAGLLFFFIIEKFVHWHHCHRVEHAHHLKPLVYTNLIGDGFHNFLDGVIIASSYFISVPVGLATTVAVILHEVPQEIGDFGVLLFSGLKKKSAIILNFFSASLAIAGALCALMVINRVESLEKVLMAIAGGGFIYIAGSDLIPELHKECRSCRSAYQFLIMLAGVGIMVLFLFIE